MNPDHGKQPPRYGAPVPREQPPTQEPYQSPPPTQPQQQWHQPPPPQAQQPQAAPGQGPGPALGPQQGAPPAQPGPAMAQQTPPAAQQMPPPAQQMPPTAQQMPPTAQQVRPPEGAPGPGRPQLRPITIEEIIQTDVVTAERDTPLRTVVAKLAEEDVGSVVVVEDDEPVGIITDRAIALSLETTPDVSNRQADDLVDGQVVTGTTEMSVFEAIRQLEEAEIRRLPVVDEDGTLAGIVTVDDILVLLGAELDNVCSIIRAQSPRL